MSKFANNMKTLLLLGVLTGLLLVAGHFIGGGNGVLIALVIAGVMNFVSFFFSDKIALSAMRAEQVGPDHPLYRITEELAQRANMPMPRVYVSPQMAPNAFATGRGPNHAAVCATQGLLQMLNRNEIAGVMAHELAHVKHRDILIQSIAITIGAAISYLGYILMFSGPSQSDEEGGGGANPLAAILVLILGPIAAAILQASISRQREYAADTEGANICGDPMYLATALEKIHVAAHRIPMDTNPAFNAMMIAEPRNLMGSLANAFASHPPLESRLENLIGRPTTGMRFAA
jgi:heat shock protein HtpX